MTVRAETEMLWLNKVLPFQEKELIVKDILAILNSLSKQMWFLSAVEKCISYYYNFNSSLHTNVFWEVHLFWVGFFSLFGFQ